MEKIKILGIEDVSPSREDFFVIGAFNPGVAKLGKKSILLLRVAEKAKITDGYLNVPIFDDSNKKIVVKRFALNDANFDFKDPRIITNCTKNYITSMSHLRVATSDDGRNFTVSAKPAIQCCNQLQAYGVEDSRITKIDDTYYIAYSSASDYGIVVSLSSTQDFENFEYRGVIFSPDNKDVAIFPKKINGKYYALHRPCTAEFGKPEMWIAESDNLLYWGNHKHLASVRAQYFDSGRIGASCVPFLTDKGWVEIYHGATVENRYCLGVMLLDANDPTKILARSERPLIEPTEDFEMNGFFGNVVFSCGCNVSGENVDVYYGAADSCVGLARITMQDIWENLNLL